MRYFVIFSFVPFICLQISIKHTVSKNIYMFNTIICLSIRPPVPHGSKEAWLVSHQCFNLHNTDKYKIQLSTG